METVKIIIGFSRVKDDDLDTKTEVIINSMTGNANFPTPVPPLAEVSAKNTAYVAALGAAKTGGKEETALKNQARKALEASLRLLGLYVEANCQNNEAIALSSGFDLQKAATPVGILPKPEDFTVENGPAAGTLEVGAKKIKGAKSYVFECTPAPVTDASVWTAKFNTAKSLLFEGLTPGKQYAFRMAGIGSDTMLVYSDIILRYVQ